jgi:hypothetical protein
MHYRIIICCLVIAGMSCHNKQRYPYAISDFPNRYQPYLVSILNTGIAGFSDEEKYVGEKFSNADLKKLSKSEHPLLRTVALRKLLDRKSIDHLSLILSHLSDTAWVSIDMGEWGYNYCMVSDDMLDHTIWQIEKGRKTIEQKLVTQHPYLSTACKLVARMEPKEEYYLHIKKMLSRKRWYFIDLSHAAYGLAAFQRKDDILLIKDLLMQNLLDLDETSFLLMQKFPDTAYLEVLQEFSGSPLRLQICVYGNSSVLPMFLKTVATYKNQTAAGILSTILNKKYLLNCGRDTIYLHREILSAIQENECPAFAGINKEIKAR